MSDRAVSGGLAVALASCVVAPRALVVAAVASFACLVIASACRGGALRCRAWSWWLTALGGGVVVVAAASMVVSGGGRYGAVLTFGLLSIPLVALALGTIGDRSAIVEAMWRGATSGAIAAGVLAIAQVVVLDAARATGGAANAIAFGDAVLVLVVVSTALRPATRIGRQPSGVMSTWCAVVLGSCGVALSGARGAWIAAPVAAFVVVGAQPGALRRRSVASAIAATVGLVLVVGRRQLARGGDAIENVTGYVETGSAGPAAGTNVGLRFESWRTSLEAFVERPVTGVGWGNLPGRFVSDAGVGRRADGIAEFDHAHNTFVDAAASAGLIGLAAVVALLALPARRFVSEARQLELGRRAVGAAGTACLAAYAVFGLTDALLHSALPVTVFSIVIGGLVAALPPTAAPAVAPARRRVSPRASDLLAEYPTGLVGFHVYGNVS